MKTNYLLFPFGIKKTTLHLLDNFLLKTILKSIINPASASKAWTIADELKPKKTMAQITISNPATTYSKFFIFVKFISNDLISILKMIIASITQFKIRVTLFTHYAAMQFWVVDSLQLMRQCKCKFASFTGFAFYQDFPIMNFNKFFAKYQT